MPNAPKSLQRQLTLWLLLPLALVLGISSIVSYYRALYFANLAYDRSLYRAALALADQVDVDGDRVVANLPQVAKNLLEYDEEDVIYYRVSGPNGDMVLGDSNLPLPRKLPVPDEHIFYDSHLNGQAIRVVAFSLPIQKAAVNGEILVLVAETLSKRGAIVQEIVEEMIIPQLLILLLAASLIFIGIKRGLLPLQRLQDSINQRSHRDLSELNAGDAPREIQPLLNAMNNLMGRVRGTMKLQQQFIADASHQMRTPIAGLQTQAELALREKDPEAIHTTLEHVLSSSSRLSHLLSRLLSMASVDPAAGRDPRLNQLNLIELVTKVTSDFVGNARAKKIDLGLDIKVQQATILGDDLMLREMLSNLIDNAINYTPNKGIITVTVEKISDKIQLSVIDNGIGIPLEERSQVFERFHRLRDNEGEGCGLGLAIVKEIVLAHNADIEISDGLQTNKNDGCGAKVSVKFNHEI
jgi:two-component system sensor histidine kinase TctE